MKVGRLPSELFRSFQIFFTVRSTVAGGCVAHSVFGSMLSSRVAPVTPFSGTATSMFADEQVHTCFFPATPEAPEAPDKPEAPATFTSALSATAKYSPSDSPENTSRPEALVTPDCVASGWFTAMSPASVLAMLRHTCASLPVIFDQSTG